MQPPVPANRESRRFAARNYQHAAAGRTGALHAFARLGCSSLDHLAATWARKANDCLLRRRRYGRSPKPRRWLLCRFVTSTSGGRAADCLRTCNLVRDSERHSFASPSPAVDDDEGGKSYPAQGPVSDHLKSGLPLCRRAGAKFHLMTAKRALRKIRRRRGAFPDPAKDSFHEHLLGSDRRLQADDAGARGPSALTARKGGAASGS